MHPHLAVRFLTLTTIAIGLGCSHSDPAGAGTSYLGDEPFQTGDPVQLTFSPSVEGRPYYSIAGSYLAYGAGRGTGGGRQDLCLAVLPGSGGQQQLNDCADQPDAASRIEAVEHAAINDDGRIAFVRHTGLTGGFGSIDAQLYFTDLQPATQPRPILELGRFYPGVDGRWDYLLGMAWTGPDEITAMATSVAIGEVCAFCPIDTLYSGSQVVKIRTDRTPATFTVVGSAGGASRMAVDVDAGEIYLLQGSTINRMPLSGGSLEPFHTPPPINGTVADTVSSIAAGGGALYYARHTLAVVSNVVSETHAIYRADGPNTASIVFLSGAVRLGDHITVTGDGRRLAFEGISIGSRNIYRVEVAP